MRQKIMNESKYKYEGKTPAEISNLEKEELSRLRSKSIKDLTYEEMEDIVVFFLEKTQNQKH